MFKIATAAALVLAAQTAAQAGTWQITSIDGTPVRGPAELHLGEDGRLSGTAGCNRFTGQGAYADQVLDLSKPLAVTRMACADPAADARERAVLTLLQGDVAVAYDPYLKEVTLAANGHELTLSPAAAAAAGSGPDAKPAVFDAREVVVTGITTQLNLRARPGTAAGVVAQLQPGSVHENLGCTSARTRDWCQLSLENGVRGWAAAEFLRPLTLGQRAKDGDFDRTGRLPCADSGGQEARLCEYGAAYSGNETIVSVFTAADTPAVLHFRDGVFDPAASFGPFGTDAGVSQLQENGTRITVNGLRLDVPAQALQP